MAPSSSSSSRSWRTPARVGPQRVPPPSSRDPRGLAYVTLTARGPHLARARWFHVERAVSRAPSANRRGGELHTCAHERCWAGGGASRARRRMSGTGTPPVRRNATALPALRERRMSAPSRALPRISSVSEVLATGRGEAGRSSRHEWTHSGLLRWGQVSRGTDGRESRRVCGYGFPGAYCLAPRGTGSVPSASPGSAARDARRKTASAPSSVQGPSSTLPQTLARHPAVGD